MPTDGVVVKRLLRAPARVVFDAWTRPELMTRWFFPDAAWTAEITSDLRVGGRYEISMRDADGGRHLQFGQYREIVPVTRLVFTWNCPELQVVESLVTVDLVERDGHTELSLLHELPPDPKVRRGHEDGWIGCLGNLEKMLTPTENGETKNEVDPG